MKANATQLARHEKHDSETGNIVRKISRKTRGVDSIGKGLANSNETSACWVMPTIVVLLTFVTFLPTLNNGFLNWDDEPNLVANPNYRGLRWSHLRWMLTSFHMGHYQPLSWATFGIDYLIWGMNPTGYHLTNLLLHTGNALLFYFLSLRLLRIALSDSSRPGELSVLLATGFAALFFSLHPLRVESVAWVTERRDVLSAMFLFAAVNSYLRAVEHRAIETVRKRSMIVCGILYILSLLSKASGMTFPLVLLILDVYPLRRLGGGPGKWLGAPARSIWWEKTPFLALGAGAALVAAAAQQYSGAMVTWANYNLAQRMAQAVYGTALYLFKTALPLNLSPLYEIPQNLNIWDLSFIASGAIVMAVSLGLFLARTHWPAGLASWVYYIVTLAPVLGIAQSGPQIAADRYTYLSCLGWAILAGAGVHFVWALNGSHRIGRQSFLLSNSFAVVLLISLSVLTWKQTQVWLNSETFWRHTLSIGPSTTGHYHLGLFLDKRGELEEAVQNYRQALEIKSDYLDARMGLAEALARQGNLAEATEHFRRALEIHPGHSDLRVNYANALALQGHAQEAIQQYHEALRIDPANGNAYFNLGSTYARMGQSEKAMQSYRDALRVKPTHSDAHFSLANALVRRGNLNEAIGHYQQAIKYKPDFAEAHHNFGRVLAAQGRLGEAIEQFQRAVVVRSDFAEAHASLAQALAEAGRKDEAARHYQEAMRALRSR